MHVDRYGGWEHLAWHDRVERGYEHWLAQCNDYGWTKNWAVGHYDRIARYGILRLFCPSCRVKLKEYCERLKLPAIF